MKGPTICRLSLGKARRTSNPSPKTRPRGTKTSSRASHDRLSPRIGSADGNQLITSFRFFLSWLGSLEPRAGHYDYRSRLAVDGNNCSSSDLVFRGREEQDGCRHLFHLRPNFVIRLRHGGAVRRCV